MASPSIDHAIQIASALGVGGIVVKALEYWAKRRGAERREPANMTRAAAELSVALSAGSKDLLNELRKEMAFLRGRIVDLQAEVDKGHEAAIAARALAEAAQAEQAKSQSGHAECKAEVAALKAQIEILMAGPVATYGQAFGK